MQIRGNNKYHIQYRQTDNSEKNTKQN